MKLAVTGALEAGQLAPIVLRGSYESLFGSASRIGYDGIEIHTDVPEQTDASVLKELAAKYGLVITALGTGGAYGKRHFFLASEEETVRGQAIDYIKAHIDLAEKLDCMVIIGLIKGKAMQCGSKEAYFEVLKDSLGTCVRYAEKHGVTLVLEMINRYESDVLNQIGEGMEYIRAFHSQNLKLHLDLFHMNIEERDIPQAIQKAKGIIGYVHAADSDRWYAGHGHYDFGATFAALEAAGYDGVISMESYSFPDPEISAAKSLETLRKLMKA